MRIAGNTKLPNRSTVLPHFTYWLLHNAWYPLAHSRPLPMADETPTLSLLSEDEDGGEDAAAAAAAACSSDDAHAAASAAQPASQAVICIDDDDDESGNGDALEAHTDAAGIDIDDSSAGEVIEIPDSQALDNSLSSDYYVDEDEGPAAAGIPSLPSASAVSTAAAIAAETSMWSAAARCVLPRLSIRAECVEVEETGTTGSRLVAVRLMWPAAALEIGVMVTGGEPTGLAYVWPQRDDAGRSLPSSVAHARLTALFAALAVVENTPGAKLAAFAARLHASDVVVNELRLKKDVVVTITDEEDVKGQARAALTPYLQFLSEGFQRKGAAAPASTHFQKVREEVVMAAAYAAESLRSYCCVCGRRHASTLSLPRTCDSYECSAAELNDISYIDLRDQLPRSGFLAEFLLSSTLAALANPQRRAATVGTVPAAYKLDPARRAAAAQAAHQSHQAAQEQLRQQYASYHPRYAAAVPVAPKPVVDECDYDTLIRDLKALQATVELLRLLALPSNVCIRAALVDGYLASQGMGEGMRASVRRAVEQHPCPTSDPTGERGGSRLAYAAIRAGGVAASSSSSSSAAAASASSFSSSAAASSASSSSGVDIDRWCKLLWWLLRSVTHTGSFHQEFR